MLWIQDLAWKIDILKIKLSMRYIFRYAISLSIFIFANTSFQALAAEPVDSSDIQIQNVQFQLKSGKEGLLLNFSKPLNGLSLSLKINGSETTFHPKDGTSEFPLLDTDKKGQLVFLQFQSKHKLYHISKTANNSYRVKRIPLWLSVIPPAFAIILALLFKEVIFALFMGVFSGAFIASGMRFDSFYYFILSFFETISKYLITTMMDADHLAVIIFSLLIGGMVAIISRNGGMAGVVTHLSKHAKTPASTQFITWLLGVAIFFDDYANTLIVGNTMRSITDKFRISREKLAYIVDSTAAPVAAIAFITTWIGAELGYIGEGIVHLEGFNQDLSPYSIFLSSLKYAYYPVLTLIFILLIIFMKKDFGPMYKAEYRARTTGRVSSATKGVDDEPDMEDLSPLPGITYKWFNAVIPVSLVVIVTILGLISTGMDNLYLQLAEAGINVDSGHWGVIWQNMNLLDSSETSWIVKVGIIVGNSNSFTALIWGSLSGVVAAVILTNSQRIMKLNETMFSMLAGFKTMMPALVILCLAWSLAITTRELHTAEFITSALDGLVNPYFMPMIIFILSALIAFSTGSSWSTMAILFPIALPASWYISKAYGLDEATSTELLYNVIRGILGAAVLGDHVSPISDTTILSSLAADCNHLDHVKTQMPYALIVGLVSIISITVAGYWGGTFFSNGIILLADVGILYLIIRFFGKTLPAYRTSN